MSLKKAHSPTSTERAWWAGTAAESTVLLPQFMRLTDLSHEYSRGRVLIQQAVTQKPLAGAGVGGAHPAWGPGVVDESMASLASCH